MKTLNFTLHNQNGREYNPDKELVGKNVVLYFYPKNSTPGCSIQMNQFTALHNQFIDENTEIIGISKDSIISHSKWCSKMQTPFTVLSDPDFKVIKMFDAKKRGLFKTLRSTYIFNDKHELIKEWRKVNVLSHQKEVLDYIKLLNK